jgi:methionyl-tRNA formyltransferase
VGGSKAMKAVFFGTPKYVLPIVKKIPNLAAVATQAPKAAGRKKEISSSAVDDWARKNKIKVIYNLNKVPQADLGIVAAYGKIIPASVITKFKFGVINIHPSLLPKYRGTSPVQAAIKNGDKITGATFIKMDAKIDHGPIIFQFKEKIKSNDTTGSLRKRLFKESAQSLTTLISNYLNNKLKPKAQKHKLAIYCKPLKKQDGFINPKKIQKALNGINAKKIDCFIRAMTPWPGAWTKINLNRTNNTNRLKILEAHLTKSSTNHYSLSIDKAQLEGKNPVAWEQFRQGYPRSSFS